MMRKLIIYLSFLSFVLYFPLQNLAKITIITKKTVVTSVCPLKDGKNKLKPAPISYLAPPAASFFNEIVNGDTKFPKNKWTFKKGAPLNGKMIIDKYNSKFKGNHYSGAIISIRYIKGKGDPKNLRWVQMIDTSNPLNNAKPPYIDPFPNDDPSGEGLPFYYTNNEIKTRRNGKNDEGKFDIRFYDFSKRYHPPTKGESWEASLHISSYDVKKKIVTIHDGIGWGWVGGCAEEKKLPKGAKIICPEKVTAGKPVTVSVVDENNKLLTGVKIIFGEVKKTTDANGRCTFVIPEGITTIPIQLEQLGLESVEPIDVISRSDMPVSIEKTVPIIEECPDYVLSGDEIKITGGPFDGEIKGNRVKIGDRNVKLLSSSPGEIIGRLFSDIPIGSILPMTITTKGGTSKSVNLTFIRFRLEADTTKLFKGQGTKGRLIIEGTRKKIKIEIRNMTPGIISLKGGDVLRKKTKGGKNNYCSIRFKGLNKGDFMITAKVIQKRKKR